MKSTTFDPLVAMTYPLAQSHTLQENGTLAVERRFLENTAGYPAGFAISNVLDMAHFALLHLNQGHIRDTTLLSPSTIALMHTTQAQLFTRKDRHYGLTFCLETYRGHRLVGHDGTIGSFGCQFALLPDEGMGAILLYNYPDLDGPGIIHSIFDRLLTGLDKAARSTSIKNQRREPKRVPGERALWPRYRGTYLSPYLGLVKVQVHRNQLLLELYDEQIILYPRRKHLYTGTWEASQLEVTVGFVLEDDESVQYIVVNPYGDDSVYHFVECKRFEIEPHSLSTDNTALKTYEGTYTHPELGIYTISVENGLCFLTIQNENDHMLCSPISKDQFACRWGIFEFQKDSQGNITGIEHKGHRITLPKYLPNVLEKKAVTSL